MTSRSAAYAPNMSTPERIVLDDDDIQVCRWVWQNLVPRQGQASTLQAELLRAIEKLRNEAMDNGNINWDSDFVKFVDLLERHLAGEPTFIDAVKDSKSCGLGAAARRRLRQGRRRRVGRAELAVLRGRSVRPDLRSHRELLSRPSRVGSARARSEADSVTCRVGLDFGRGRGRVEGRARRGSYRMSALSSFERPRAGFRANECHGQRASRHGDLHLEEGKIAALLVFVEDKISCPCALPLHPA